MPIFKPLVTQRVWKPWYVLSREISRHQINIDIIINKLAVNRKLLLKCGYLKNITKFSIKFSKLKELIKGHGLIETIWNEWKFVIFYNILVYNTKYKDLEALAVSIKGLSIGFLPIKVKYRKFKKNIQYKNLDVNFK